MLMDPKIISAFKDASNARAFERFIAETNQRFSCDPSLAPTLSFGPSPMTGSQGDVVIKYRTFNPELKASVMCNGLNHAKNMLGVDNDLYASKTVVHKVIRGIKSIQHVAVCINIEALEKLMESYRLYPADFMRAFLIEIDRPEALSGFADRIRHAGKPITR